MSNIVVHPSSLTRWGGYDMERCLQVRGFTISTAPGSRFAVACPLPQAMAGAALAPLSQDSINELIERALTQFGGR